MVDWEDDPSPSTELTKRPSNSVSSRQIDGNNSKNAVTFANEGNSHNNNPIINDAGFPLSEPPTKKVTGVKEESPPPLPSPSLTVPIPYHPRQRKKIVRFLFVCFVFTQIFVNYDSGAVPSVLEKIADEFGLGDMLLGLLGALPYIGLIVAAPFVGALLQTISPKRLLLISISTNIGAAIMLALSLNVYVLFISRFLIGVTQSGFCIYVPVWVDEFAELTYLTMWMGLIQGGTVFGVMLGYLVTGYINPWRISIAIQASILLAFLIVFIFTPAIFIDLYMPTETTPQHSPKKKRAASAFGIDESAAGEELPTVEAVGGLLPSTSLDLSSHRGATPSRASDQTDIDESPARKLAAFQRLRTRKYTDRLEPMPELGALHPPPSSASGTSGATLAEASPASAATTTSYFFGNRAPTFMAPSPAGAILETMEINAKFDNPLVLRRISTSKSQISVGKRAMMAKPPTMEIEEPRKKARATIWQHFKLLFESQIYLWTVLTLCALLFVVTAIQYWSTRFFIVTKNVGEGYVRLVFSATAATAPTAGVFLGAFLVDRLGGYRTAKGMYRSLWFCLISGLLATTAGVIAAFLEAFGGIIAMMWFLLFFGGSILPAATGILIAAVDPSVRPFASSFSMFAYNILGYALGSFLPGVFMSAFGLETGMKIIFFWSFFGVFGMAMALFFAWKDSVVPLEVSAPELATLRSMYSTIGPRRSETRAVSASGWVDTPPAIRSSNHGDGTASTTGADPS